MNNPLIDLGTQPTQPTLPPPIDLLSQSFEHSELPAFLPNSNNETQRNVRSGSLYGQGTNPTLLAVDGTTLGTLYPQEVPISNNTHDKEEGEVELYIPGLTSPSLFVLLPMNDSLTPLLERYVNGTASAPRRDMTGEWRQSSLDQLIAGRKWRAVAKYCQDMITAGDAAETSYLLAHWALRLYALTQIELIQHLSNELSQLFALLPTSSYNSPSPIAPSSDSNLLEAEPLFHPIIPFSLHVLHASLPGMKGDKETSIESLCDIVRGCKVEMWKNKKEGNLELEELWKERALRVGCMVSSLLIEIKAFPSAGSVLSSYDALATSPTLLSSLCRLYISTGDLGSYSQTIAALERSGDSKLPLAKAKALGHISDGEWSQAEGIYREILAENEGDGETINNLAVTLLFQSQVQEAISILSSMLKTNPKMGYSSETVLFNLAILTELRTDTAPMVKIGLLKSVIENGAEGLRGGCLKLAL